MEKPEQIINWVGHWDNGHKLGLSQANRHTDPLAGTCFFQKAPNPKLLITVFPSKRLCSQYDSLVYDYLVIFTALCTWKRM